jgi:hypothetical protein
MDRITAQGFQQLLASQEQYMDDFWRRSDVRVKDVREDRVKRSTLEIQQAIRFNLFHILQASARAEGTRYPWHFYENILTLRLRSSSHTDATATMLNEPAPRTSRG